MEWDFFEGGNICLIGETPFPDPLTLMTPFYLYIEWILNKHEFLVWFKGVFEVFLKYCSV